MADAWRVIIDESLPGIENMARDALLLESAAHDHEPQTTLRFYRWIIPTLSLGNKQDPEITADLDFCRDNGVDIVRRPTGGGAVLHHLELTYSIVSNDRIFFPSHSILDIYRLVADALCRGLGNLKITAQAVKNEVTARENRRNYIQSPLPCFSAPSQFEICVKDKKIIGSAQKRSREAFLQHGSIPYNYEWPLQAGAMRSTAEELQKSMTAIGEHTSSLPSYREMVEAFLQGFATSFRTKMNIEPFSEDEIRRAGAHGPLFKVDY
ncbi:MAG: lipoate--protein ligase family protein [Acidobacteria bacterium]|nr:lipoate--protein ligase family protein [Acidobacteriota bacterium]